LKHFFATGEGKKMNHGFLELPLTYQSLDATKTMSDSFTERDFGLGGVLRAREIVHAGGFGPEDFALLDAVFQAAWHHIEIKCVEGDRKASRERLASIVVALAQARGVLESEALENAAVEMFHRRP
jgi:hypothetical protein